MPVSRKKTAADIATRPSGSLSNAAAFSMARGHSSRAISTISSTLGDVFLPAGLPLWPFFHAIGFILRRFSRLCR